MFKVTPMTVNVLKNLITKKSTRPYPFVIREPFEISRGELYNVIEECIFCSTCARKCPSQCITVDKEKGIWTCDPLPACTAGHAWTSVRCTACITSGPGVPSPRPGEMITMQGTPPKPKKKAAPKKENPRNNLEKTSLVEGLCPCPHTFRMRLQIDAKGDREPQRVAIPFAFIDPCPHPLRSNAKCLRYVQKTALQKIGKYLHLYEPTENA
jgi:ech hydrogenase subunit F